MSWSEHEIVGGALDGQRKHLPCRKDGDTIWMDATKEHKHQILNSRDGTKEVFLNPNSTFHRYTHRTREDGKHVWELG